MGVVLFTGEPGSGKTYLMTKLALRSLRDGVPVYANYRIHWPGKNFVRFTNFDFFKTLEGGLALIDEIHIYFDARKWYDLPNWVKTKLNQHRHDGLEIYGTCQWFGQCDKALRELTSRVIVCERRDFLGLRLIRAEHWRRRRTGLTARFKLWRVRWHLVSSKIFNRYDTLEKLKSKSRDDSPEAIKRFD